jgi:hypothetical protein
MLPSSGSSTLLGLNDCDDGGMTLHENKIKYLQIIVA